MILVKEKRENESQFDFHDPHIHTYHIGGGSAVQPIQLQLEYRDLEKNDCDLVVLPANKVLFSISIYDPANKVHSFASKMSIWQFIQNLLISTPPSNQGIIDQIFAVFKPRPAPIGLDINQIAQYIKERSKMSIKRQFDQIQDEDSQLLRRIVLVDDSIQVQNDHFSSIYLISLAISRDIFDILGTANLSSIKTNQINIYTVGVQLLTDLINPNTPQKQMFICRIVAFSILEGVFRFIEYNDTYKIEKINLVYGNELTTNELELHHKIHKQMKKILNNMYKEEQQVSQFGLGRIEYFPGLGPQNYFNQPDNLYFFPLIPLQNEFKTIFPSIHGFIVFIYDESQFDRYMVQLKKQLEISELYNNPAIELQLTEIQLEKIILSLNIRQQIQLSAFISVQQSLCICQQMSIENKGIQLESVFRLLEEQVNIGNLYRDHIMVQIEQFQSGQKSIQGQF